MKPSPCSHRVLKFVSTWMLGHAIGIGSTIWLLIVFLDLGFERQAVATLVSGFSFCAVMQQFVLQQYGLSARLWWLTSYLGWGAGALTGVIAQEALLAFVDHWPSLTAYRFKIADPCAGVVSGLFFGAIQMFASKPLRQRVWVWPLASALAVPVAVLIGNQVALCEAKIGRYLIALLAGATYGGITGVFVAPLIQKLVSEAPKR